MTQREKEVLDGTINILKNYLDPGKIILFGSRAKQIVDQNSDFDLAIDQEKAELRLIRKINEEIDKVSGLYSVDIVFLHSVEETFRNIILKTGVVVYERKN